MTLTLAITGRDALDNGAPARIRLDRHGAIIGRSAHADWSLPDAKNHISSRHCEIGYREGRYLLTDRSTNGTYVNGSAERLTAPHPINDGDRIQVGPYELVAATERRAKPDATSAAWSDDLAAVDAVAAGWGAASLATAPASAQREGAVPLPFADGHWDMPAPVDVSSAWSSDPSNPEPPSAAQIWGELASAGEVAAVPALVLPEPDEGAWARRPAAVAAAELPAEPSAAPDTTHAVLGRMVAGIVRMVEARARAKAALAVAGTTIELDGNNPLKFIRSPERALEALLAPPQPGFMSAERAVDDAFADVETHELAMMTATRAALEETIRSLSPQAVRERARQARGNPMRSLPLFAEAALWRRYVQDFEGMVSAADEGFMDRFEKAFRREYARGIKAAKAGTAA